MSDDEALRELDRVFRADELCQPPWLIKAGALLEKATLSPEWLVPGRIPAKDLILVTGAPGAKKSWLAYALALAAAQQSRWLGIELTPRGLRPSECDALVLNYDNPTPECGRRFKRLGLRPDDRVRFHSVDSVPPWRLPDAAEDLTIVADALRPRVILIDSLRQAHTAEENSSGEMMAVMGQLKRLYTCGASVVVVHHSGKSPSGESRSRGSQEIDASATVIVHVTEERDGVQRAEWIKHRSWDLPETQKSLFFRVDDQGDLTIVGPVAAPKKGPKL